MFGLQHKERSCLGFGFFSSLLKRIKKKVHNMLSLMLDPRFKTFCLVSTLIGRKQGMAIVEKYDNFFYFLCFLKFYYHLHPLVKSERCVVDQRVEEDKSFDMFEIIISTSEPTMELVKKDLLIFNCYQVDFKNIKCPL